MLMNLVGNYHGYQLCNTGEKEICMECFLILSFTSCNTETIFNMIDADHVYMPDFLYTTQIA